MSVLGGGTQLTNRSFAILMVSNGTKVDIWNIGTLQRLFRQNVTADILILE